MTPKQQADYDRAMLDALKVYRDYGRGSLEAKTAADRAREILRKASGKQT